jgi:hypothetical protein
LQLALDPAQRSSWPFPASTDTARIEVLNAMSRAQWLIEAELCSPVPFVTVFLNRLLQELTRIGEPRQLQTNDRVVGRVQWSATLKARGACGGNPSTYICRETWHHFDTLENQLLKRLTQELQRSLAVLPDFMLDGQTLVRTPRGQIWLETAVLQRIGPVLDRALRHPQLLMVSQPPVVTGKHLERAFHASNSQYSPVARLYMRFQEFCSPPVWPQMVIAARQAFLLPARLNARSELWLEAGAALLCASKEAR